MKNRHDRRAVLAAAVAGVAAAGGAPVSAAPPARDETADRVAIEQLVVEYYYLLDHGRAAEIPRLYTADAIFDNPNSGVRAQGRAAIAAYYARRAARPWTTRHVSTNLHLVFETPDRARGTRTILYYRGEAGTPPFPAEPGSVGEYREVFERGTDGRWRFASRTSALVFSGRRAD